MATGNPVNKRGEQPRKGNPSERVELSYPNKRTVAEILAAPPGHFNPLNGHAIGSRLYFGENLSVLSSLAADPKLCGQVRLVYIDPPYATQTTFQSRTLVHAYEDVFEMAEYLEFMRERIVFLHRLLSSDGSIYLHIDDKMLFHVKLILDEVFGLSNYRNCITRKKCNPKNYTRNTFGNVSDYILFYTKSDSYVWNRQTEPWTEERAKEYQYTDEETGRRYMRVPVHAPGSRNGETGKMWRGKMPPPGKHWQFAPSKLDAFDAKGEIHWSKNGNPRRKVYLDTSTGVGVQDIWMDFRDAHNQNICVTGYPTEKNADLLRRIVNASSNAGDIVLDCFAGSGTTLSVAEELGRSWIGVDNSLEAIRTINQRLLHGVEPMGDFVTRPANQTNLFDFGDSTEQLIFGADTPAAKDYQILANETDITSLEALSI
jgi:adenine-specific DNA-methyltransferase